MWQPLSKLLDTIGRIRVTRGPPRVPLVIGQLGSVDALGGFEWRNYRTPETLHQVWGPLPDSQWEPYHCVPLFAALDTIIGAASATDNMDSAWPTAPELAAFLETEPHLAGAARREPLGQTWVESRAWVILDLPGVQSVPLGVRLALAGFQPVCTFDHWPHPKGLLHPEQILAQMLRFAPVMAQARQNLQVTNPPLWICDRDRLGTRPGNPHEFDNRYFLDDSLLPGAGVLYRAGIQQIICFIPEATMRPLEDLHAYFDVLRKEGFTQIHGVALNSDSLDTFDFGPMPSISRFKREGYQRSAAGGFGRLVPEESSSSG